MSGPKLPYEYVFTTYLAISHIFISQENTQVTLLGVFGNLLDGDIDEVTIRCDFAQLNELLALVDKQAEYAIEALFNALANPILESEEIDLTESGGLHFEDYIFALQRTSETLDANEADDYSQGAYRLNGYMERGTILPDFAGFVLPLSKVRLLHYYAQMLVMQYRFYLHFQTLGSNKNQALVRSGLLDPLVFSLAKTQFDLLTEMRNES